jgi:hypothetical protein
MAQSRRRTPRKRDYAKEYANRKARGLAAGKTLAQTRGHHEKERTGQSESQYRRARSKQKYGAGPDTLAKARREARDHILAELASVKTRHAPKVSTIERGLRMLHIRSLRELLLLPAGSLRALAGSGIEVVAEALDEDSEEWNNRNPLWYN